MKFIKRLFIGLLILIILLGASVFVLITFYKKELAALLTDTLKTNYGLTLKVEDIKVSFFSNWPHASVQLKNVEVANDYTGPGSKSIFKAGSVSLSFNLEKMLHKQFIVKYVSIKDAEINLLRTKEGAKNFEFRSPPVSTSSVSSPISFEIEKVTVKTTQFSFVNQEKQQRIALTFVDNDIRLEHYSDGIKINLDGKMLVDGLLFNPKKGEFLKHARVQLDLDATYFKDTKTVCIYPGKAEIDNENYTVVSLIDLKEDKKLAIQIKNGRAKCDRVGALLTPRMRDVLRNFEVKRPVDASVLIMVNLGKKEEPVVLVDVKGKNCDLTIGNSKIPYSGLSFHGKVISLEPSHQRGDMENARVIFQNVKGKIYDFPFTANIKVTNLTDPKIVVDARLLIEADKIKFKISQDFKLKGSTVAVIKYTGPTNKINKVDFLKTPMKLNANLFFKDLSYKEIDRPYVYVVNGKANLNNKELKFEDLNLKTNVAEAVLKGRAEDFINYVLGYTDGFKVHLAARTESLNLNPLFENTAKDEEEEKNGKEAKVQNKKISQSHFEFNVNLYAKKMVLRKVEATNTNVDLFYENDFLNIKALSLNTCDGRIIAKGTIQDFNKINADASVQNVNVSKLFTQFENFGQEAISSENLKGDLFLDAKFKTELDEKMSIKGETMAGEVKLKLKEGHLINYEPIQNLSNFLFRNRDFNDVYFSELNETFKLRGYEMYIQELEIASNILNLFVVNGVYNFKGNSNINLLIPWSNLKRRGKNYIPKSSGQTAENTKGVKLNYAGQNKKMKISLGHKEPENIN
jgi:hypothetical protein